MRTRNVASDRTRTYVMDPAEQRRALAAMEDAGETDAEGAVGEPLGVYHSHPESHAMPSPTDVRVAEWPFSFYVLVSLRYEPRFGAYRIRDGVVHKADLVD